jgi:hypothetical protein
LNQRGSDVDDTDRTAAMVYFDEDPEYAPRGELKAGIAPEALVRKPRGWRAIVDWLVLAKHDSTPAQDAPHPLLLPPAPRHTEFGRLRDFTAGSSFGHLSNAPQSTTSATGAIANTGTAPPTARPWR